MGCLLWAILFVLCWPLAVLFLFFYPVVWLGLLPLRLLGFAVGFILDFLWSIVTLPFRIIKRI